MQTGCPAAALLTHRLVLAASAFQRRSRNPPKWYFRGEMGKFLEVGILSLAGFSGKTGKGPQSRLLPVLVGREPPPPPSHRILLAEVPLTAPSSKLPSPNPPT